MDEALADFARDADTGDWSLASRYLYGQAYDQILARFDVADAETTFHLTDHQGSVRQNVDGDGLLVNEIVYDAYGNILSETNPAAGDRFKYTAREWDALVGLQWNRARWYDPLAGRWANEDPIGFNSGQLNHVVYVGNNPLNRTDPSGLEGEGMQFQLDTQAIPASRVDEMVRNGLATRSSQHPNFVVVADFMGDNIAIWLLEKYQPVEYEYVRAPVNFHIRPIEHKGDPVYRVVGMRMLFSDESLDDYTPDQLERMLAHLRSQHWANLHASTFLSGHEIQKAEDKVAALTFFLHLVPVGGTVDHISQGEWGNAAFSAAGDVAFFVSLGTSTGFTVGGKTIVQAGTGARAAASIQGAIAVGRLGQSGYALHNGDTGAAAGYLGEAFIALFGAKLAMRVKAQSFFDNLAVQATKNPSSTTVVIGKFAKSGQSYQKVAAHYKATYFKLNNWRALARTLTPDELWQINKAFLSQQIKAGKQFILSSDPAKATGFFAREVQYLMDNGYRCVQDGWVWKAIR